MAGPGRIRQALGNAHVLQTAPLEAEPPLAPETDGIAVHTRWRAIWAWLGPAAAARIIRARMTSCWAVVGRRTPVSNACRSSAVRVTGGGCGPRRALALPRCEV